MDSNETIMSIKMIWERFLAKEYTFDFIENAFKSFSHRFLCTTQTQSTNKTLYVKAPYLNDHYRQKFLNILYSLYLKDSIKFYSCTSNTQNIFATHKEHQKCDTDCVFCMLMYQEN